MQRGKLRYWQVALEAYKSLFWDMDAYIETDLVPRWGRGRPGKSLRGSRWGAHCVKSMCRVLKGGFDRVIKARGGQKGLSRVKASH